MTAHLYYDLKPIINKYLPFKDLVNINGLYKQAKIDVGGYGVIWNDELDISSNKKDGFQNEYTGANI